MPTMPDETAEERAMRRLRERVQQREVMRAMRTLARDAKARGLTSSGDVIEDVADWELGDDA